MKLWYKVRNIASNMNSIWYKGQKYTELDHWRSSDTKQEIMQQTYMWINLRDINTRNYSTDEAITGNNVILSIGKKDFSYPKSNDKIHIQHKEMNKK